MALGEAPTDETINLPDEPRLFRWTRTQYHQLEPLNLFLEQRVELIEGQIVEAFRVTGPHFVGTLRATAALQAIFDDAYFVSVRNPVILDEYSEPEPDVAIFVGNVRDLTALPTDPVLVVEVSDNSLAYDRTTKARIYAHAGIADYWILDVQAEVLEVYRNPANGKYDLKVIYRKGQSVAPLAAPQSRVLVDDLLT